MILRAKFTKEGYLKYISHLDIMRLFQRAFRMANIPIAYTEGFNPHPRFSIATALSLGISSEGEYMDVELETSMPIREFIDNMNNVLPEGIRIIDGEYVNDGKSISSLIRWGFYEIEFKIDEEIVKEDIINSFNSFTKKEEVVITKEKKKGNRSVKKEIDIRPNIGNIVLKEINSDTIVLRALLRTGDSGNLKPIDLLSAIKLYTNISIIDDSVKIHRMELYTEKQNKIATPL